MPRVKSLKSPILRDKIINLGEFCKRLGRLPQHGRCGDGPLGFGRQEEYGVNSKKSDLAIRAID